MQATEATARIEKYIDDRSVDNLFHIPMRGGFSKCGVYQDIDGRESSRLTAWQLSIFLYSPWSSNASGVTLGAGKLLGQPDKFWSEVGGGVTCFGLASLPKVVKLLP